MELKEIFEFDKKLKDIAKEIYLDDSLFEEYDYSTGRESIISRLYNELPENKFSRYKSAYIKLKENKEEAKKYIKCRLLDKEKEIFEIDTEFFINRFITHLKHYYINTLIEYKK